jgi:hypothetical protein
VDALVSEEGRVSDLRGSWHGKFRAPAQVLILSLGPSWRAPFGQQGLMSSEERGAELNGVFMHKLTGEASEFVLGIFPSNVLSIIRVERR